MNRWVGGLFVVTGVAIGLTARSYTVGFMVDPVGPRAMPYLVACLFVVAGVALLIRRRPPGPGTEGTGRIRVQLVAVGVFLLYAGLINPLGFLPPTVLATGALAKLFGGKWVHGLGVDLILGFALLALFSWGFGLNLPTGYLFGGGP